MGFKEMREAEQFHRNAEQFRKVEQRAQRLENVPRPLTKEERQFLEAYNIYRPAIQQMLKVADLVRSSQTSLVQMKSELEANKPSRTKEIFTGTVTTAVGALSLIGHPFVQIYESVSGNEIVTLKDTAQVMGEAGRYITGKQTKAWQEAASLAARVERRLDNLYAAYNNMVGGLISGDSTKIQRAEYELGNAVNDLKDTQKALSDLMDRYRPELEQLGGFFDLSKKFLKDAAIEIVITVASVKALKFALQHAPHVLPKLAGKTAEKLGVITAGVVNAERVMVAGRGLVRGIAFTERYGLKAKHIYEAEQEIDHVASEHADVQIALAH